MALEENELQRLNVGDFAASETKVRQDKEFCDFISGAYKVCADAAEPKIKEAQDLWNRFSADAIKDFEQIAAADEEKKAEVFRSSLMATKVWTVASIILDTKPRIYLNPVFSENAMQRTVSAISEDEKRLGIPPPQPGPNGEPPPAGHWMDKAIADMQFEPFWNKVLDQLTDDWWAKSGMYGKLFILTQKGLVQGKSWAKIRKVNGTAVFENLPIESVVEDPMAETKMERRYLFHRKHLHVRTIEKMWNQKKGSVIADPAISGKVSDELASQKDVPDEIKYRVPQCLVKEGYFLDDTEDDTGIPKYPFGRIITFIEGQDTDTGVLVLDDYPNEWPFVPVCDYIPRPGVKETDGIPLARYLNPLDTIADKTIQRSAANLDAVGSAYIAYNEDNAPEDIDKFGMVPGIKVPVKDIVGLHIVPPQPVTLAGQNFFSFLANVAEDVSGVHEVSTGRKPGGIESGRGIIALQSTDVRSARPYVEALFDFLTPIATNFGAMILSIADKGFKIKYGEGYRHFYKLPLKLSDVIEDVEAYVTQDTELPKDKTSIFNLLKEFAGQLPPSVLIDLLPVDIDKEKIKKEMDLMSQLQGQIAQLQDQLKQSGQQVQQSQMTLQQVMEENNDMRMKEMAGVQKGQIDSAKQSKSARLSLIREKMRQDSNLQRAGLQSATQIATAKIAAQNKPVAGGPGESRER